MPDNANLLGKLADTICTVAATAKANNTIQPEEELIWKTKVEEFEYSDAGITKASAEGSYATRTTWFRAKIALAKEILAHADFASALAQLERDFPGISPIRPHLEGLISKTFQICLEDESAKSVKPKIDAMIETFLGQLSGQLVTYRAKVELVGITLRSAMIPLDADVIIRQPTKDDLEATVRVSSGHHRPITYPSAVLEVKFHAPTNEGALLQAKVEQSVALLRLFDVGSVKWTSYDMDSDSLLGYFGGTMIAGGGVNAVETYVIKHEDESKCRNFWQRLSPLLPKDIYDFQKQVSHLTLAYDRYSDGVLNNGVFERRLANAVMGLEALFLKESQELSYRLGLRISKILSILGKNPLTVRNDLKEAYSIRSAFAHGGHLDYKGKRRLERKYGNIKKFLVPVLDYLRLSIVTIIVSRFSKDELVDLLDDALIDADRHQELQARISGVRPLVGL